MLAKRSFFFRAIPARSARLFKLINQHPTLFEQISGRVKAVKHAAAGPQRPAGDAKRAKTAGGMGYKSEPGDEQQPPHSSTTAHPSGRLLTYDDVKPTLRGRFAEVSACL